MEPRIQYCRTSDGVSIAYWTLGEGWPVVNLPFSPGTHIQLEWEDTDFRRWYERMAQTQTVIRFDGRGMGLSDRDVTDFSLDATMLDIEAVVDHLGLERFALAGIVFTGPVAIAYAAGHPERVSHLLLWSTYWQPAELQSPQFEALLPLADADWELFTETVAHAMAAGWGSSDQARRFANLLRQGVDKETFKAMREQALTQDVSDLLERVEAPTLVSHRRDAGWPSLDSAKSLAARIPNARLSLLEGASLLPFVGDMEAAARLSEDLLGIESPPAQAYAEARAGGLITILFTDIAGSTDLTQRLGDAKAQDLVRQHDAIVRQALSAHAGTEVKHTGDGIMASFQSTSQALECALAIEGAVAERADRMLVVRIGLNAGEPLAEDSDLYGTAVQLARRICDEAAPGEVLVSNVVRELAAGKGFDFADRGEVTLKGFEAPARLWQMR